MDSSCSGGGVSSTARQRHLSSKLRAPWKPGTAALLLLCMLAVYTTPSQLCCLAWTNAAWKPALEDLPASDIPQILHQSSSDGKVPEQYKPHQASWRRLHPAWELKHWSDASNRALIVDHYPELLQHYTDLKTAQMKSEFSCYLYMYHFGGVYADLTMECLRPLGSLLTGHSVVLGRMGTNHSLAHSIPTSFMASTPHHPFWQFVITKSLMAKMVQLSTFNGTRYCGAESVTGSVLLQQAVRAFYQYQLSAVPSKAGRLTVLPHGTLYPVDWKLLEDREAGRLNATAAAAVAWVSCCLEGSADFDRNLCKDEVALHVPWAHTLTYWPQSLGKELAQKLKGA